MTRTRFTQRMDGQWVHWARSGHDVACCDCGKVHRMWPRVRAGRVEIKAIQLPRHTAGRRTALKRKQG